MGGLRNEVGRITIESRRESFVVHADYGDTDLDMLWTETPDPEFANEDLDDLIVALQELQANPR